MLYAPHTSFTLNPRVVTSVMNDEFVRVIDSFIDGKCSCYAARPITLVEEIADRFRVYGWRVHNNLGNFTIAADQINQLPLSFLFEKSGACLTGKIAPETVRAFPSIDGNDFYVEFPWRPLLARIFGGAGTFTKIGKMNRLVFDRVYQPA